MECRQARTVIVDLREADSSLAITTDVCIIGGGAAGITVARRLRASGCRVCLVESGGLDYEAATQDLYDGPNLGMPYYELVDARLRFFGGTTNIWGGRCTPFEPIDFAGRAWVRHSGWPIGDATLQPYYHQAHAALDLGEYCYDERLWARVGTGPPALDPERLVTRFWRFDTLKERFNASRCDDLFSDPEVVVLLHANALHLQADSHARAVTHVVVSTLTGRRLDLRARFFVLACGGIENARLLLASNDIEARGLGNRHDQVGRFFMEHQHGRVGEVVTDAPYRLWHQFRKVRPRGGGPPLAPTLLPAPALQERLGILNSAMTLKLQRDPTRGLLLNDRIYRALKHQLPPDRTRRRLWHTYRDVRGWVQRNLKPALDRYRSRRGLRKLYLMIRAEQAPNPESRVRLDSVRDALGMPRAALDWRPSRVDKDTVAALASVCSAEFSRLGMGTVTPSAWLDDSELMWPVDPTVSKHPIAGYHHMGTTRMSAAPAEGVVDADCRVHGYANLYVAGSSVFATGSWANPTLTIIALALRLADRLVDEMARGADVPR